MSKVKKPVKQTTTMASSPDASIGHELTETMGKKVRIGTAIYWEYTGSTIRNMKTNEEWPAFRFRMEGKRGGQWWSCSYADKTKPVPKSLLDLREALVAINKSRAHAASWAGMLGSYIAKVDQLIARGTT